MLKVTSELLSNYSNGLNHLLDVFYALNKPYGIKEINRFNNVYLSICNDISLREKRRVGHLIDTMRENTDTPDLVINVYNYNNTSTP